MRQIPTESDLPAHPWNPYTQLHRERIRAHRKHEASGGSAELLSGVDFGRFLPILVEEVGEVAKEVCEAGFDGKLSSERLRKLRTELVQVGAMAAAWIDALGPEIHELERAEFEERAKEAGTRRLQEGSHWRLCRPFAICERCGEEVAYCQERHDESEEAQP